MATRFAISPNELGEPFHAVVCVRDHAVLPPRRLAPREG